MTSGAQGKGDEPPRVVAFGGGTGLPVLLEGLRSPIGDRLTAVVSVADDGGSSGRLRHELGVAPPGDVRSCLVALAGRRRLAEVFDYRFEGGTELRDHSVGNLIIAALAEMSGGFCEGVQEAARFLRITGRVYPAATESLTLVVQYTDGTVTRGESTVRESGRVVARVTAEPATAVAPDGVLEALERADLVVLSSGSLFTSTIPALLGGGVSEALARVGCPIVYVANVMTQPGETAGYALSDHLEAIEQHVGPLVTDVLVNATPLPARIVERYEADGASPVVIDRDEVEAMGVRVREAVMLPDSLDAEVRHDPDRVARAVLELSDPAASPTAKESP